MVTKRSYLLPLCWSLQTGSFAIWSRGRDCIWVRGTLHHFAIVCAHKVTPLLLCLKFFLSWIKNKGLCLVWSHFNVASSASSDATAFLLSKGLSPTRTKNIHCVFATVVFLLPTMMQVSLLLCPSMVFVIINGSDENNLSRKLCYIGQIKRRCFAKTQQHPCRLQEPTCKFLETHMWHSARMSLPPLVTVFKTQQTKKYLGESKTNTPGGYSCYSLSLALAEKLGCVVITLILKFHYG